MANSAFMKPMNLSPELEDIVGKGPMARSEVVKKLWEYIKGDDYEDKDTKKKGSSLRNGATLQDQKDKRTINADDKLEKIFGKKQVNMFEMTKLVSGHLS